MKTYYVLLKKERYSIEPRIHGVTEDSQVARQWLNWVTDSDAVAVQENAEIRADEPYRTLKETCTEPWEAADPMADHAKQDFLAGQLRPEKVGA